MNFWQPLQRPIVGLSPMDGVTDAPFRYVTAKYGRPDVIFTEFVPVEAITHNAVEVMQDFLYSKIERPVVAQIYGADPDSFYKVAHVVCEMGFDGLDINMGCPAKNVVHSGCGAGLINNPPRAKAIIRACKQGIKDWAEGSTLERVGIPEDIIQWVKKFKSPLPGGEGIPISIKTRLGYSENVITDWVKHLLEEEPVVISIHGRTLKQMYKGAADWEAIASAADIIHQTPTLVLGNGDVKNAADAIEKIQRGGVDGVLVGRAACGNPWVFRRKEEIRQHVILSAAKDLALDSSASPQNDKLRSRWVTPEVALECMLEHARQFEILRPDVRYVAMRKHIGWYAQWIPELRARKKELMQVNSYAELVALCYPLPRGEGQGEGGVQVASPQPSPVGGGGLCD